MPPVYAASDIAVLPTFREGLSQVALECGAMEVPVVGTRIPGMVDPVTEGVTGLLVPAGESRPFAAAVRRLLNDESLRQQFGAAGRRSVSARFSEDRVNRLFLAEYQDLSSRRSRITAAAARTSGWN